jgi:hypothetical protein
VTGVQTCALPILCHKCQTKIGVVLLIIFVVLAGMVFVGLL